MNFDSNKKLQKNLITKNDNININTDLSKPKWMKIKLPNSFDTINKLKNILRKNNLNTVCEEALCPNLYECFNNFTATFMILGNICTRKCPFCAVNKGRPNFVDAEEPKRLSETVFQMGLKYIVITSVNRDDLKDGGANQFIRCIKKLRVNKHLKIEVLVPDFRNTQKYALSLFSQNPPDVFNHNLENVQRLYKIIRPGADYYHSLNLLYHFKRKNHNVPTKSGLMLGLGETFKEIIDTLADLKSHGVTMLTLGQYLQPSKKHLAVKRYITDLEFQHLKYEAISMGFTNVFCGSFVRSSYHANLQIK